MTAVAAGYRKGLVSAGWPALLSCTNERRKWSFHLVDLGTPFLAFWAAVSLEERSVIVGVVRVMNLQ